MIKPIFISLIQEQRVTRLAYCYIASREHLDAQRAQLSEFIEAGEKDEKLQIWRGAIGGRSAVVDGFDEWLHHSAHLMMAFHVEDVVELGARELVQAHRIFGRPRHRGRILGTHDEDGGGMIAHADRRVRGSGCAGGGWLKLE